MKKLLKSIILLVVSCCLIFVGGLLFHFNSEDAFYSVVKKEYVIEQVYCLSGLIMASIGIQYIIVCMIKDMNGDLGKAYRYIGNIYIFFAIMSAVLCPSELSIPTWQKFVIVFNISGYVMAIFSGFYALITFIRFLLVKWKTVSKNKIV